jgi:hypothetical protein
VYGAAVSGASISGTQVLTETSLADHVQAYPNPVIDKLYTTGLPLGSPYKLRNSAGVVVSDGKISEEPIAVGHFSAGLYILETRQNNKLVRIKVIKKN